MGGRGSTYDYQSDASAGDTALEGGIIMGLLFFLGENLHCCVLGDLGGLCRVVDSAGLLLKSICCRARSSRIDFVWANLCSISLLKGVAVAGIRVFAAFVLAGRIAS